jgi:hypothetical protein
MVREVRLLLFRRAKCYLVVEEPEGQDIDATRAKDLIL